MATGCDKRLVAAVDDLTDANAEVVYLVHPMPKLSKRWDRPPLCPSRKLKTALSWVRSSRGEACMAKPLGLLGRTASAFGLPTNISRMTLPACARLAALIEFIYTSKFDAVLMPVWFWGTQLGSLAREIFPNLRHYFGVDRGPLLLALADDAHAAREAGLANFEQDRRGHNLFLANAKKMMIGEKSIYEAADAAIFITASDIAATRALGSLGTPAEATSALLLRHTFVLPRDMWHKDGWDRRRGTGGGVRKCREI